MDAAVGAPGDRQRHAARAARRIVASARSSSSCTVRSPGCRAQPANSRAVVLDRQLGPVARELDGVAASAQTELEEDHLGRVATRRGPSLRMRV